MEGWMILLAIALFQGVAAWARRRGRRPQQATPDVEAEAPEAPAEMSQRWGETISGAPSRGDLLERLRQAAEAATEAMREAQRPPRPEPVRRPARRSPATDPVAAAVDVADVSSDAAPWRPGSMRRAARVGPRQPAIRRALGSRRSLQQAFLVAEILGKPVARRRR